MPTTVPARPLYCGTCLQDLTSKAEHKLDKRDPKMVCKSLKKLLDEAKMHRSTGDDEMAYIFYLRWLHCISWLQKTPDYIRNRDFLRPYVVGSEVKEVLNIVEEMSKKLEARYDAEKLKKSTKQMMDTVEKMQIEPDHTNNDDLLNEIGDFELKLPDTPTDEPTKEEPEIMITCMEMYQEMQKLADRMIIIDIRTKEDFNHSHIDNKQCINIPSDFIKYGILAANLFASLKGDKTTCLVINHRCRIHCDLIVLLDWQTTKACLKPDNHLNVLKTILLDWDPGVAYSKIVILDGGYKEWLSRFPTLTTNPNVTVPDLEGNSLTEILDDVKYPDWNQSDEDQPMVEQIFKPIPARNLKPTPNEKKDIMNRNSNILDDHSPAWSKRNRSMNRKNVTSIGSIGSLELGNNIPESGFSDETKDVVPRSVIGEKNINENESKFDKISKVNRVNTKPAESDIVKPTIDRSSKPSAEKIYDANSKKMLNLLEQQKDLAKSQLKLEKDLLKANRLFGSEEDEDLDPIRKAETLKQMAIINTAMTEKVEQISAIKEKMNKYREHGIEVDPIHHDEKFKLEVDISLAEHEAQVMAMKRREIISERDKKAEEILESKRKNMSTPPNEPERDTVKVPLKQDGLSMNSSLKRSYSSPNLAQLESRKESIGRGLDNKVPQVDRTSKPLQQQYRENIASSAVNNKAHLRRDREQRMSPIYGNMHPGITGLKNLGNSCYMNSIIQCLSNTTTLARYFIDGIYTDYLNTKNRKTQGHVAEEVAQVIKALWCGHYRSISPRDLKVAIGQYKSQFQNEEQQDSHEFLTFLLDWMHDDLKTTAKLETDRSLSNAEKEWNKAMDGQTSIISKLFFGQLRSTISCSSCGNSSTTYETFNSLTLSLPDTNRCTLDDCIRRYVSGQRVSGWRCPSCKAARDATKKFDFVKLAPIIVVHLNRFGETGGWIQKISTAVDFPLTSLDLRSYVAHDSGNTNTNSYHQTYNLYAVSNHYGTMEGGHYTAYCNSASQNKWYKYDDHTVREVSPNEVKSQTASAYLLFYTSVPNSPYIPM